MKCVCTFERLHATGAVQGYTKYILSASQGKTLLRID